MRCDACGIKLRVSKRPGLKVGASIVGQLLLVWFVYLGITEWNWWPMFGLLLISVMSPFAIAIFGKVEPWESQNKGGPLQKGSRTS